MFEIKCDFLTGEIGEVLCLLERKKNILICFGDNVVYSAPIAGIYKAKALNNFVLEEFEKNLSLFLCNKEITQFYIAPNGDIFWKKITLKEETEGIEKEITIIFYPDYELMLRAFSSGEYLYSMPAYKFKIYSWLKRLSNLII